jgi:hypothetical protein
MKIISAIVTTAYLLLVSHFHTGVVHADHSVELEQSSAESWGYVSQDGHQDNHTETHQHGWHSEAHQHHEHSEDHQHPILLSLDKRRDSVDYQVLNSYQIPLSEKDFLNIKPDTIRFSSVWLRPKVYLRACVFLQ